MSTSWPQPLLQPDPHEGCMLYSMAYLCHCLGHTEVTPEQIRQYRAETGYTESSFLDQYLSIKSDNYWHHAIKSDYQRFWLGKEQLVWVEQHLAAKQIALVCVHRIPEKGHIVVLLESDDTSVLLADPLIGHIRETWDWFLGIGPGIHGCHRIDGWYSRRIQK